MKNVNVLSMVDNGNAISRYIRNLKTALPEKVEIYDFDSKFSWRGISFPNNINTVITHLFPRTLPRIKKKGVSQSEFNILHFSEPLIPYNRETLDMFDSSVVTIHDNPVSLFATDWFFNSRVARTLFKNTFSKYLKLPYVIANTKYVMKSLIEYGFDQKISYCYHPISKAFFPVNNRSELRKQLLFPLDKKLILSISSAAPRKNLKMVKQISEQLDTSWKVIRIGPPVPNCINLGEVDDYTLNLIYNAVDALFMPSFEEGQGMPVVEALTVGLPVVISDIEVFREVAKEAAFFVDPNDKSSCIRGLKYAASNRDSFIEKSRELGRMFTMEVFARRMGCIYERIEKGQDLA